MSKELIINVSSDKLILALIENNQLVELQHENNDNKFSVGDIYLGKVKKIIPGLNAAFVDIGHPKDAFLHYLDLGANFNTLNKYLKLALSKKESLPKLCRVKPEPILDKEGKITDVLKEGQSILVQIAKEPISTKGPRLCSEISIAGRNIVLMPCADKVSISQKVKSFEEKKRLKTLVQSIIPKNYGSIVRTVAEDKKVADLHNELNLLIEEWEASVKKLSNTKPPKLVMGELSKTSAVLRDLLNSSFNNIYVNDEAIYNEAKSYIATIAPEKKKIVKFVDDRKAPIFEKYGVNKQISTLFGRTVTLKNGSYLVIEHTEALHVIDVNSGNMAKKNIDQELNALEVNLAAAEEIARQLRLRDMGGIIVVDFIDMINNENKHKVYEKIKEAMKADNTKHTILPLSKFGLMQITRQRVRPVTNIDTKESCPTCKGKGTINSSVMLVDDILSKLKRLSDKYPGKKVVLRAHPYVVSHITKGFFSLKFKWRHKYGLKFKAQEIHSYELLRYDFWDEDNNEIK